jgi:hypothetical protein
MVICASEDDIAGAQGVSAGGIVHVMLQPHDRRRETDLRNPIPQYIDLRPARDCMSACRKVKAIDVRDVDMVLVDQDEIRNLFRNASRESRPA